MIPPDTDTLSTLLGWRRAGFEVDLVTVVNTWGSAPRPVGSIAAVRADGAVAGSVSGGCIERQLAQSRQRDACVSTSCLRVGDDTARAVGLSCGGELELVFESIRQTASIESVLQAMTRHKRVLRELEVETGNIVLRDATAQDTFSWDGQRLCRIFGPRWRLLLIGAGELSRHVAQMALMLDFDVVVCEPRMPFREAFEIPQITLVDELPDDAVAAYVGDLHSAVLALSHDPTLDDLALEQALGTECFYIGALGSTRSHARRRQRLDAQGVDALALERISAPIGIDIGSRTSAEIAVSVVAELIERRAALAYGPSA